MQTSTKGYYAIFDLVAAALLSSNYNENVRWEGNDISFSEAIDRGADALRFIRHQRVLRFARDEMEPDFADAVERLRELREYASYRPSITFRDRTTPFVNTCVIDAPRFINSVQQENDRLETYFQSFRNFLRGQPRVDPDQDAYGLAETFIEQHAEDPIRELGRYRNEQAITLAREIHATVFPYTPHS